MSYTKSRTLDATQGSILRPLIAFSIPIMLTNILQILFNAADIVIVGQFGSENSVGAIGSTTSIINLMINFFTGISIGATVIISNEIGAKAKNKDETAHTVYALGIVFGVFTAILGQIIAKPFLLMLGTPVEILPKALLYLRIYYLGLPGFMIYTFARAILICTGETKAPLRYLAFSGGANLVLNLFLVCVIKLDVAGVAIATIVSQYISAILVTRKLHKIEGDFHLDFKKIRIHKEKLFPIIRMGLPAGIQSAVFSIAGMIFQRSVNSLGAVAVDGNSAAQSINMFAFQAMSAFAQGAMTFSGQNYGAKKYPRLNRVFTRTILCQLVMGGLVSIIVLILGPKLLLIYLPDSPEAIDYGVVSLNMMMSFCFIAGMQETASNMLRGIKKSFLPMITVIVGNCVMRIAWIVLVFNWAVKVFDSITSYRFLMIAYPVTWGFTFVVNLIIYIVCYVRLIKKRPASEETASENIEFKNLPA